MWKSLERVNACPVLHSYALKNAKHSHSTIIENKHYFLQQSFINSLKGPFWEQVCLIKFNHLFLFVGAKASIFFENIRYKIKE